MDMDKGSRTLGWLGLITGGALSVGANVRSIHLPDMPDVDLGSYVVAVAPVALAMLGIEQVARWRHLPDVLRYGVVGLASLIAVAASWTHIVSVMKHYGQPDAIAYSFPLAVDGIMLLSSLSLFVSFPDRTPDTEPVRYAVAVSETDSVWTDKDGHVLPGQDTDNGADSLPVDTDVDMSAPDTSLDTDTLDPDGPDSGQHEYAGLRPGALYVPDTWTPDAPVSPAPVPAPRRNVQRAWMPTATELIGEGMSDAEIAARIMTVDPGAWPSREAGRKAISRLRKSL